MSIQKSQLKSHFPHLISHVGMRTELETKKYAMGIHMGTRNELDQKWVYKHNLYLVLPEN